MTDEIKDSKKFKRLQPKEKIKFLQGLTQHDQRTPGWFKQREGKLTSSDGGSALGLNPYEKPIEFVFKKCGAGPPFTGNVATLHGQKWEDPAIDEYCKLMGKKNYDFGLLTLDSVNVLETDAPDECPESLRNFRNPGSMKFFTDVYPDIDLSFIAGSTDGIAIDRKNMEDLLVLEVKCPYRRKIIPGYCPEYYYPQVQLNMFILDIEKADFIEYTPPNVPPKFSKTGEMNIVRIHRSEEWFLENVPKLSALWKDVLYWREHGIKNHPEYHKYAYKPKPKVESLFIDDEDDQETLVSKIDGMMFREDTGFSSKTKGFSRPGGPGNVRKSRVSLPIVAPISELLGPTSVSITKSFKDSSLGYSELGSSGTLKLSADMFRND